MRMHAMAVELMNLVEAAQSADDLADAVGHLTVQLGFEYFALTHHVDIEAATADAIRIHNYPEAWADYYDRHALGISDPVHRASHVTSVGFCWSRIPDMIALTPADHRTLELGRQQGIGDGFTVPAHVPGEARGSCSFARPAGRGLPCDELPLAQLAGAFAFEAARRVWIGRGRQVENAPRLTDRQRDCLLWIARGKSDWETSRILDVGEETVRSHVKQACERYDVSKRTSLIIRTLFDGTISFGDVLRRGHPPFGG
ncbi:LuxR family transcriptional regulator [Sphingomonas sp. PL-96]|uniref:LuxR family transcriptional regulator n=1 Tax=Sphingomonas sp. PL-96 TaxID=2887201 RepID=UPI001E56D8DE|nr:LuxR family transcriptional regulator [Sphingomonas sp. PL-96]MCC2977135.1 LuxR family transcriptional regulator [Sphingomonas sp. PL-96]